MVYKVNNAVSDYSVTNYLSKNNKILVEAVSTAGLSDDYKRKSQGSPWLLFILQNYGVERFRLEYVIIALDGYGLFKVKTVHDNCNARSVGILENGAVRGMLTLCAEHYCAAFNEVREVLDRCAWR